MTLFGVQIEFVSENFAGLSYDAAVVRERQFYECFFTNCSFCETKFQNCRFIDCTFEGCDLSSINLEGSTFRNTKFENSKLIGVDWTIVSWPNLILASPIHFQECVVDFSIFLGLTLPDICFRECSIKDVEFSEADLTGGDFTKAILTKSRFNQSNFTGADFQNAREYSIDVTNNRISNARVSVPEAMSLLQGLGIRLEGMDPP